jgi:hypothetical protein
LPSVRVEQASRWQSMPSRHSVSARSCKGESHVSTRKYTRWAR